MQYILYMCVPSIFSGLSSFGDSYNKALFATLERQLTASLEVSGWGIKFCVQICICFEGFHAAGIHR